MGTTVEKRAAVQIRAQQEVVAGGVLQEVGEASQPRLHCSFNVLMEVEADGFTTTGFSCALIKLLIRAQ